MVYFNGSNVQVVRRVNRPSTNDKVSLELIILNNGSLYEPYQVCSVQVFPKVISSGEGTPLHYFQDNVTSSTNFGIVAVSATNTSANFVWSGNAGLAASIPGGSAYTGTPATASSLYRFAAGHYAVVLQPDASSVLSGTTKGNSASAIGDYFDVWTIVNVSGSRANLYINEFSLFDDSFVGIVEDIVLTAKNKLRTTRIPLGATQQLQFETNITVLNKNITDEIKAVIEDSVLDNAQVKITKYNEDGILPAAYTVSGFADTSAYVSVDSADTITFLFNTNALSTLAALGNTVGNPKGIYHAQVKFTLFDQTFVSEEFPFLIV